MEIIHIENPMSNQVCVSFLRSLTWPLWRSPGFGLVFSTLDTIRKWWWHVGDSLPNRL